jgi:hypothetical protein
LPPAGIIDFNINSNLRLELFAMAAEQLLLRLPEELVRRFRRAVSGRQRSLFVQNFLAQALPPLDSDDDPL